MSLKKMNRTRQLLLFFVLTMAQGAWGQTVSKYHVGQIAGIGPQGWLQTMMQRQHDGLTGHSEALSYPYNTCLWAGEISRSDETYGENWWRYEQAAY